MKSSALVNVVTPFYNTKEYLRECIESVLRQKCDDWQYLLVDNCSTDGSSDIAREYQSRFPEKIRLIRTTSFLSQVDNYNFALSSISPDSKYCKVVQADDWLFPDCIKSMVEVAEANPTVGIVAAYELEGDEVRLDGLPFPSPRLSGLYVGRLYFLRGRYLFGTPTSLLMRSELVRSRTPFYDQRYAPFEDGHACFDLLTTWEFGFVHQVLTYSRRDNDGIISRICPFNIEPFLHLTMLIAHGRDYLSSAEYDLCLRRAEWHYFRFLANNACALNRPGREFWEFHRNGLASVGIHLDWRCLAKWIPRAIIEKGWDSCWRAWDGSARPDERDACTLQQNADLNLTVGRRV